MLRLRCVSRFVTAFIKYYWSEKEEMNENGKGTKVSESPEHQFWTWMSRSCMRCAISLHQGFTAGPLSYCLKVHLFCDKVSSPLILPRAGPRTAPCRGQTCLTRHTNCPKHGKQPSDECALLLRCQNSVNVSTALKMTGLSISTQ